MNFFTKQAVHDALNENKIECDDYNFESMLRLSEMLENIRLDIGLSYTNSGASTNKNPDISNNT